MSFNQKVKSVYVDNNHVTVQMDDGSLKLYAWQQGDEANKAQAEAILMRGREFIPNANSINSILQKLPPEERAVMAVALGMKTSVLS